MLFPHIFPPVTVHPLWGEKIFKIVACKIWDTAKYYVSENSNELVIKNNFATINFMSKMCQNNDMVVRYPGMYWKYLSFCKTFCKKKYLYVWIAAVSCWNEH